MKKSPSTVTRQDILDIFRFYCIEMICSSFHVKVIFTTSTFRIWGLHKVQKGVWGKMLHCNSLPRQLFHMVHCFC